MKHLLALMALYMAFAAGAQTGLVEFPYNPDADNDDVIGTADLLALLSLYGSEFSEEDLYLNSDSSSALYHASTSMRYYDCHRVCHELPGNWGIASRDDFYKTDITMLDQGVAWVRTDLSSSFPGDNYNDIGEYYWSIFVGYSDSNNGRITRYAFNVSRDCYCATHERPKVEYSYCVAGSWNDALGACAQEKVQDGWYPLGGASTNSNASTQVQAFWRWAE